MSDDTTPREETEPPATPATATPATATPATATPATATPATATAATAGSDRRPSNRGWLLIVAAALVFGCFVGAGAMAVGAFVAGHIFHGRDRAYVDHDRRGDRRPQPPIRKQPAPNLPGRPDQPKLPPRIPSPAPTPTSSQPG